MRATQCRLQPVRRASRSSSGVLGFTSTSAIPGSREPGVHDDVGPSARGFVALEVDTFDCIIHLPRVNDLGLEPAVLVGHLEDDVAMRKPGEFVHESPRRQIDLIRVRRQAWSGKR